MKKRFWIKILTLLLIACCIVNLVACKDPKNSHKHTFANTWTIDETHHWYAATCEHTTEVKDKAPHSFEDGKCIVCGYESFTLSYTPINNDTAYCVTGVAPKTITSIVVPAEHNGKPVTMVGEGAFNNMKNLESVILPESVVTVRRAFQSCPMLKTVVIPNPNIGDDDFSVAAFYKSNALENVTLPMAAIPDAGQYFNLSNLKNVVITNGDMIPFKAFINATKLEKVTIPESVDYIKEAAFSGCSSLKSIVVPGDIINVERYAFQNCTSLKEISFLKSAYMSKDALIGCTALEKAHIPITMISSMEVVSDSLTTLTAHGSLPDDTGVGLGVSINAFAFFRLTNLKHITIAEVQVLSLRVFEDCYSLESIVLPSTLTNIGSNLTDNCSDTLKIFYEGTAEEWDLINIHNENDSNAHFLSLQRYYLSETQPTVEGNFWHYVDGVPTVWE